MLPGLDALPLRREWVAQFRRAVAALLQSQTYTAYTTAGTSTAYTIVPSPAIRAYAAGQSFFVTFNAACGAAPTFTISGLATPPNLVKQNRDGTYSNINAGDIPINHRSRVTLLSATQAWVEVLPVSGVVIDRAYTEYTSYTGLTAIIPYDDTIPQSGEGTQILSVAITPKSTTNRLRIRFRCQFSLNVATTGIAAMFSDASANALAASAAFAATTGGAFPLDLTHEYVPGVTTAVTVSVRVGPDQVATMLLNGTTGTRTFGGVNKATLVIEEITP